MAVTVDSIRARPEFATTDEQVITDAIAEADAQVSASFGPARDLAVGLLACHVLAMSPHGEPLRLDPRKQPDGVSSLYERRFKAFEKRASRAPRGPVVVV